MPPTIRQAQNNRQYADPLIWIRIRILDPHDRRHLHRPLISVPLISVAIQHKLASKNGSSGYKLFAVDSVKILMLSTQLW